MAHLFNEEYVHWRFWLGAVAVTVLALLQLGCLARPTSVAEGAVREGVGVELWASDGCPRVGETVTVRATVINQSSSPLVAELDDQPVLDIILADKDGQHRWSDGKQLTSELTRFEVKPGESKSIEMQYNVKQGYIGIAARFIPDTRYIEQPVSPSMVIGGCPGFLGP